MDLQEIIKDIEKRIVGIKNELAIWEEVLEMVSHLGQNKDPVGYHQPRPHGTTALIIVNVLKQKGRATKIAECAKALEDAGVETQGKQQGLYGIAAQMLNRRKDLFVKVSPGVYDLQDRGNNEDNPTR